MIIYKRYGKDLNEYNNICDDELELLHIVIFKEIEANLLKMNMIMPKDFMSYFNNIEISSILEMIVNLNNTEKFIIKKAFGSKLEETNPLSKNEYNQLIIIIDKIKSIIITDKVKDKANLFSNIFSSLNLIDIINYLPKNYKKILYKVFDENLKGFNMLSEDELNYIIYLIIPKIKDLYAELQLREQGTFIPTALYRELNISYEDFISLFNYLSNDEKVALYKYYGYDLETPQNNDVSKSVKHYITTTIIPKLYKLLLIDNVLENNPNEITL